MCDISLAEIYLAFPFPLIYESIDNTHELQSLNKSKRTSIYLIYVCDKAKRMINASVIS